MLCLCGRVYALAGLSRACAFDAIPVELQVPAARFFNIIGAAPVGKFDSLPSLSQRQKHRWWVLESLTIDWGSVRYYLYAENRVYWRDPKAEFALWRHFRSTRSAAGWTAERVPDAVLSDSNLSIFLHNRAFFYSARAGHPEIIEYLDDPDRFEYAVSGNHYYYDPVGKSQGYIGWTRETTCNLSNWGFEAR